MSGVRVLVSPEGDVSFARLIDNCPQLEELTVNCNDKGEEECMHVARSTMSYSGSVSLLNLSVGLMDPTSHYP